MGEGRCRGALRTVAGGCQGWEAVAAAVEGVARVRADLAVLRQGV
jgi:hypothetical protein